MSDIVERLRDACVIEPNYGKSVRLTLGYDDYMEAAAEIETLTALVKRLQAQLADYEREAEAPVHCEGATE